MARHVCFRHPQYDGSSPPELSCRACCGIFLAAIKADRDRQVADEAKQWQPMDLEANPNKFVPAAQGTPPERR